ncbi:hypothetical protein [Kribbella sp. NPDC048915]|uniref:hypothetical protein n=1 Tax=Kribbella sp. NPDC048915 TaxID=3155148 RepID=UPI0033FBA826
MSAYDPGMTTLIHKDERCGSSPGYSALVTDARRARTRVRMIESAPALDDRARSRGVG